MKKVVFALLFLGLFQFSDQKTFACSCSDHFTPLFIEYSRANAVFVGEVKGIKKLTKLTEIEKNIPANYVVIEFKILKAYKGINNSQKIFSVITTFNDSCGFVDDERPQKGQKWIIFAFKNEENNRLYFGNACEQSSRLENETDISDYENEMFKMKDKQAIFGRVVDEMKIEGIKDIEIILEGNGQNLVARTDEEGFYSFPVTSTGTYKITINLPFGGLYAGLSPFVKDIQIKENLDEMTKPFKTILIYEVQLKEREFNYEEVDVYVIQPKK